jgi:hemerythrin superfamily protein
VDPIKMLKDDHRKVEKLFARFEKLGDKAKSTKQQIVMNLIKELRLHAEIEETIVYPALRQAKEDMEDDVLEAYEEHHLVKRTLSELESMTPDDDMFDAKVCVLCEAIEHHVEEEEDELLPALKKALDKEQLAEIGRQVKQAKSPRRAREAA